MLHDDADEMRYTGTLVQPKYGAPYREFRIRDTPAERWQRMRAWVASELRGIP